MSENVVTGSDVAPLKVPKSFNDLNKEQLVAAALAFGADENGTKESIRADLLETGVTFEQYLNAFHPNVAEPKEEPDALPDPADVEEELVEPQQGGEEMPDIITASPSPDLSVEQKYLIKFIGHNPYFEFGKYRFTTEKPYGIMNAFDAQNALVSEPDKFRQAFPAELEEYYG